MQPNLCGLKSVFCVKNVRRMAQKNGKILIDIFVIVVCWLLCAAKCV